jgi:lipoprotein-releasing system permease protein
VSAATPLVQGEVMVTSQTNLSGVILRGIDPTQGGAAINLRRDLIRGRVEYLDRPRGASITCPRASAVPVVGRGELELPTTRLDGLSGFSDTGALRPPPPGAPTDPLPGIVVGRELATNLHLAVGDEVRVVSPFGSIGPLGPMPKTKLFASRASSTRACTSTTPSMRTCHPRGAALLQLPRRGHHGDRGAAARRRPLRPVLAAVEGPARARSLRVRDWKELNQNLFRALKLEKLLIWLLLTVAIIVASFSHRGDAAAAGDREGPRDRGAQGHGGERRVHHPGVPVAWAGSSGWWARCSGRARRVLSLMVMKRVGIPLDPEVYYIDRLPVLIAPADYSLVFVTVGAHLPVGGDLPGGARGSAPTRRGASVLVTTEASVEGRGGR